MDKLKKWANEEFLAGKTAFDWGFLAFGILLQIVAIIFDFATGNPETWWVIVSGLTGIISVILCAQGKISFYVFGYIQLITYVFGVAIPFALWGELIENIFYFITMIIGTVIWFKNYGKTDKGEIKIKAKRLDLKGWLISLGVFAVSTVALALLLIALPDIMPALNIDPFPWLDSVTTTAPFIAQIFLMLGYREQWAFWVVEDIISIIMFCLLGSWIMVAQYLFWTINCMYGWYKWSENGKLAGNT